MKNHIFAASLVVAVLLSGIASAAEIRNSDAEDRAVTITEKGVRSEQTVAASATITACVAGCFIIFPNGEMLPLVGPENVVIENGRGRVVSK